jgi:hypothetical protein
MRSLFAVIAGILLLAVIVTGIFLAQRVLTSGDKGATPGASDTVAINIKESDLACVRAIGWSPNGAQFAALGYERACPRNEATAYDYHPGHVSVYDAISGKLAYQLQPDVAIRSALNLKAPVNVAPDPNVPGRGDTSQQIIDYSHIAWQPTASRLILTFNIYPIIDHSQGNVSQTISGALFTDLTSSQT